MLRLAFQSTLPRGSDLPMSRLAPMAQHFNPRSLAGATISGTKFKTLIGISIHAPSRERPTDSTDYLFPTVISIHAPSRERPRDADLLEALKQISIHAPSRERHHYQHKFQILYKFQSTLPRGSDGLNSLSTSSYLNFNPRSLAGATAVIL